ncbi:MAG: DEAD/DEAH box helicase family protein [Hyphomonas sp.]
MPVARILFTLPLPEPFDYAVPEGMEIAEGSYVAAPVGKYDRLGIVVEILPDAAGEGRALKEVAEVYPVPPMTAAMRDFLSFSARYTVSHPGQLLSMALRARGGLLPSPTETVYEATGAMPARMTEAREKVLEAAGQSDALTAAELAQAAGVSSGVVKGLAEAGALRALEMLSDPPFPKPDPDLPGADLTAEQEEAAEALRAAARAGGFQPFLIDGVTGSGKTEVYFEAIAETLKADPEAQVLVLLPEIALTQAILSRFEARFGAPPAPWHSGLPTRSGGGPGARRRMGGRGSIGARSALLLPFRKLKLVIVDEEHDGSFKQEEGVTYHARDMAVMRAKPRTPR